MENNSLADEIYIWSHQKGITVTASFNKLPNENNSNNSSSNENNLYKQSYIIPYENDSPIIPIPIQSNNYNNIIPLEALKIAGIFGKIKLDKEYLIIIVKRQIVANILNKNIYKASDIEIIPLQYEEASKRISRLIKKVQIKEIKINLPSSLPSSLPRSSPSSSSNDADTHDSEIEYDSEMDETDHITDNITDLDQILNDFNNNNNNPFVPFVSKIIKSLQSLFKLGEFYFSYQLDITHPIAQSSCSNFFQKNSFLNIKNRRKSFVYNEHAFQPFLNTPLALPVVCGYVGQYQFQYQFNYNTSNAKVTVISLRGTKRAGLRYLRRGIDNDSNCANWVETEQLLEFQNLSDIKKNNQKSTLVGFLQLRGSIPIFFTQSPYKLQPTPKITRSLQLTAPTFHDHFTKIRMKYGDVQIVSLVEKNGREAAVGKAYEFLANKFRLNFEWFDFHAECRNMKFQNVDKLFSTKVGYALSSYGWTENGTDTIQLGVLRINCIDCLDRTNVVESSCAWRMLQMQLNHYNLIVKDKTQFEKNYNSIWADNGDAISKQYSSTSALKGDFTRTKKRNYKGIITDAVLTMNRYFSALFSDFFTQAVIDFLLGNVGVSVFSEFEARLISSDPGLNLPSARESAIDIASRIVVGYSDTEEIIGGWWLLSNLTENSIGMQLHECILILSDCAIYICNFDFLQEVVNKFERIPLDNIKHFKYGVYYTSGLVKSQLEPEKNMGFILSYSKNELFRSYSYENMDKDLEKDIHKDNNINSKSDDDDDENENINETIDLNQLKNCQDIENDNNDDKKNNDINNDENYEEDKVEIVNDKAISEENNQDNEYFIAIKFPPNMDQIESKIIINQIKDALPNSEFIEEDIVSLEKAKASTSILESFSFWVRKMVWA